MEKFEQFEALVKKQISKVGILSEEVSIITREHETFLRGKGWNKCNYSGYIVPGDLLGECFDTHGDYLIGRKKTFLKRYVEPENGNVKYDTVLQQYFLREQFFNKDIYIKDKREKLVNGHAEYLMGEGKLWKAPILRQKPIYVDFQHFYYDNHSSPKNWKVPAGDTYGIELELKFPDALSKLKFSVDLHKKFPDWGCERDGSLENIEGEGNAGQGGLELISPPLSFADHLSITPEVIDLVKEYKGIGHDTGSPDYGLHITAKLNEKNPNLSGQNIIRFFHDPKLQEFFQVISRRERNKFCLTFDSAEKAITNGINYDPSNPLYCFTRDYGDGNHYKATCVRAGMKAIEARQFRSTVKKNTILASIEFMHLLRNYSLNKYNTVEYLEYILSKASRRLTKYLEEVGAELQIEYIRNGKGNNYNDNE